MRGFYPFTMNTPTPGTRISLERRLMTIQSAKIIGVRIPYNVYEQIIVKTCITVELPDVHPMEWYNQFSNTCNASVWRVKHEIR